MFSSKSAQKVKNFSLHVTYFKWKKIADNFTNKQTNCARFAV
mgnify:FL=1